LVQNTTDNIDTRDPKPEDPNMRKSFSGQKQSRNPDSGILISRNSPESSVSKDEREREYAGIRGGFRDSGMSNPGVSGKARIRTGIPNSGYSGA